MPTPSAFFTPPLILEDDDAIGMMRLHLTLSTVSMKVSPCRSKGLASTIVAQLSAIQSKVEIKRSITPQVYVYGCSKRHGGYRFSTE